MFATLEANKLGADLRVECFRGTESLCRPYRFDIQFTVTGSDEVDLAAAVGSAAKLKLARDPDHPQTFAGIIASARLVVQTAEWMLFEATLVPKLWGLGMTRHSHVFTKTNIVDIIERVLKDASLGPEDYELRLSASYAEEELVVQYRESKLDFLHRWMEHEGIYYFFEQGDAGEKVVIVDDKSAHDKMVDKTTRYRPLMGHDTSADECFDTFTFHHNITVKRVVLSDYDYGRPALDVSAHEDVSQHGFGEVSLQSGRFFDPDVAKRYAKLRAEELRAKEAVQHASGTALHVGAGYLVELSEHPSDKLNKKYLVTEARHFCNQMPQDRAKTLAAYVHPDFDETYRVQCQTLDAEIPFRATRATPWPRVQGYENGIVDGEADSPYAQIDDQGRYLVKFFFDESDLDTGKASTFVRMMQPHGGSTEGFHFPLRKETEVIFTFLGGDPDRPVIAGVVPNATTPSPVTSNNHTQNVIRTGANNHIILNDEAGKEYISFRTPNNNTGLYMGNPIGGAIASFDGENQRWEDGGAGSVRLYTDGTTHFNIGGHWFINSKLKDELCHGPVTEDYKALHKTTVGGDREENVAGSVTEMYDGDQTTQVLGSRNETITGTESVIVNGPRDITAAGGEAHKVTGTFFTDASSKIHLSSPTIQAFASADAHIMGPTTTIEGTDILIKGANITLDGGSVLIKTPDFNQENPDESWFGALFDGNWAKKIELTGFAYGATALKIEMCGVAKTAEGVFSKTSGLYKKLYGSESEAGGASNKAATVKNYLTGLFTVT